MRSVQTSQHTEKAFQMLVLVRTRFKQTLRQQLSFIAQSPRLRGSSCSTPSTSAAA